MKALVLSDLHISMEYVKYDIKRESFKKELERQIKEHYDIVLISGDVFEHSVIHYTNPFFFLNYFFNSKKVIFCLGNHEFAYEKYQDVINKWTFCSDKYRGNNIYCLDICNYVDIDNYRILGNVFWYDFSLNKNRLLMKGEIIDGWLDATIEDFDPIKENENCQNKIINNISDDKTNILLTHMVPHEQLNTFSIEEPDSVYNAYSGNADFLQKIENKNFKYAICGHTHRREIKTIHNINCINIGNDYFFRTHKIEYFIIEL